MLITGLVCLSVYWQDYWKIFMKLLEGVSRFCHLPSSKHHLSYDDCLQDKRKLFCAELCSANP